MASITIGNNTRCSTGNSSTSDLESNIRKANSNRRQPPKMVRRLMVLRDTLIHPGNWSAGVTKLMHPGTFSLVRDENGDCRNFLKTNLPMDIKQEGFTNFEGEDNRYFTLFRRDAAILHPTDFVEKSIEPILKPLLTDLLADELSTEQIDATISLLKSPTILHKQGYALRSEFENIKYSVRRQLPDLPTEFSPRQINLILSAYNALVETCEYRMESLRDQGQTVRYKDMRRLAKVSPNYSPEKCRTSMPTDLEQPFTTHLREYHEIALRYSRKAHPLPECDTSHISERLAETVAAVLTEFSEKRSPIKRVDRHYLASKNLDIPFIHPTDTGFQLLDHHRIWGATILKLPIEVNFSSVPTKN